MKNDNLYLLYLFTRDCHFNLNLHLDDPEMRQRWIWGFWSWNGGFRSIRMNVNAHSVDSMPSVFYSWDEMRIKQILRTKDKVSDIIISYPLNWQLFQSGSEELKVKSNKDWVYKTSDKNYFQLSSLTTPSEHLCRYPDDNNAANNSSSAGKFPSPCKPEAKPHRSEQITKFTIQAPISVGEKTWPKQRSSFLHVAWAGSCR